MVYSVGAEPGLRSSASQMKRKNALSCSDRANVRLCNARSIAAARSSGVLTEDAIKPKPVSDYMAGYVALQQNA